MSNVLRHHSRNFCWSRHTLVASCESFQVLEERPYPKPRQWSKIWTAKFTAHRSRIEAIMKYFFHHTMKYETSQYRLRNMNSNQPYDAEGHKVWASSPRKLANESSEKLRFPRALAKIWCPLPLLPTGYLPPKLASKPSATRPLWAHKSNSPHRLSQICSPYPHVN
jgi:hypothetical protein